MACNSPFAICWKGFGRTGAEDEWILKKVRDGLVPVIKSNIIKEDVIAFSILNKNLERVAFWREIIEILS